MHFLNGLWMSGIAHELSENITWYCEYYIDSKANEIPHTKVVHLLKNCQRHWMPTNREESICNGHCRVWFYWTYTVSLITTARLDGVIIDKQDLREKLESTENRLGEYEDRNAQLKSQNEELQRKLKELNPKNKILQRGYKPREGMAQILDI